MLTQIISMNHSPGFVSIGAGNVASHLVESLCASGFRLLQVYSRTIESANALALPFFASSTTSISEIKNEADFYLVSIPDKVIPDFLKEFTIHNKLIFHTAGSFGLEVFGSNYPSCGVMYPLQTFTKGIEINLRIVPVLIEASDKRTFFEIKEIACAISDTVKECDSENRRWIHLAAVFASNFTNHMYVASSEILRERNLDPDLLRPLIDETFRKSRTVDPSEAQTGPAVRNDSNTMEKHIKMLENLPFLQKIYTFTSQSIQFSQSSKNNKSVK